ncbi:Predicted arabinose efflux permease, MFS family [Flexibacter flexilis DSM 6793]|uniref:Predicted arabinose efflux permease, MFS family n=1 Tax=Flexibacter flexilis DSM 6793 TaxID=927664 RepID=A0A1I1FX57_9BACT|nr:MFS transporter [Flexibacter flexilis]SFC02198.1 Predicted arabinose efflux permease, MFS family [Flexibacter flexilis DSM 6793]
MKTSPSANADKFTGYQLFIVIILALLQFTIILDFMVLSPLGAILMPEMHITTGQFGAVVSGYAFSAGASGLLAAGFADRFDRKKFLMFFYVGFLFGTSLCAMATSYEFLLMARIITGIFGGVIGSVSFAIITDLFVPQMRGRVMAAVQMAFAASQILGLPIGLSLANAYNWHVPFWVIVGLGIVLGVVIMVYMKPIEGHLHLQKLDRHPLHHLFTTVSNSYYLRAFVATTLLATGGFMLMPFGSTFTTNNLKIPMEDLPWIYGITGVSTMIVSPIIGLLSDKIGRFPVFAIGTFIGLSMVAVYTHFGVTPLWVCIAVSVVMFVGINARMISASALVSEVPAPQDRGAFMSVNSSVQQISGGVASFVAGLIVVQNPDGSLGNYPLLGYTVIGSMLVALGLIYWLNSYMQQQKAKAVAAA